MRSKLSWQNPFTFVLCWLMPHSSLPLFLVIFLLFFHLQVNILLSVFNDMQLKRQRETIIIFIVLFLFRPAFVFYIRNVDHQCNDVANVLSTKCIIINKWFCAELKATIHINHGKFQNSKTNCHLNVSSAVCFLVRALHLVSAWDNHGKRDRLKFASIN